jgi:hypothetical protein
MVDAEKFDKTRKCLGKGGYKLKRGKVVVKITGFLHSSSRKAEESRK